MHVAKRRKALTALLQKLYRRCCGGGARAARGRVLADERFRRCVRLLAEPGGAEAFAAERREALRVVASLAQEPGALAPVSADLDEAFSLAAAELDTAPSAAVTLHWAATRCGRAGAPVSAAGALAKAEAALDLSFRVLPGALESAAPPPEVLAASLPLRADEIATRAGKSPEREARSRGDAAATTRSVRG